MPAASTTPSSSSTDLAALSAAAPRFAKRPKVVTSIPSAETKRITVSADAATLVSNSVTAASAYATAASTAYTAVLAASPTAATTATRSATISTATALTTSAGLSTATTINYQLHNYLSNKQCCLESLAMESLAKLKIGSPDARCKQKEIIFGNILFEILSCLEFRDTYASYTNCYPTTYNMNNTLYPIIIAFYVGDLSGTYTTITPFLLLTPGMTAIDYFTLVANAINVYTVQSGGYTADLGIQNGNVCITIYSPSTVNSTFKSWSISNGSSSYNTYNLVSTSIADECLTEEDVCVIAPYLNKICESC